MTAATEALSERPGVEAVEAIVAVTVNVSTRQHGHCLDKTSCIKVHAHKFDKSCKIVSLRLSLDCVNCYLKSLAPSL